MKSICIGISVFLLSISLYGQKCDFESNKKDEFTGKERKVTLDKVKPGVFLFLEKTEEVYSFRLEFTYGGALQQVIVKGTEVLLKLNSGPVIKLYTVEDHMPSKQATTTMIYSYVVMKCAISKEEITQLSTSELTLLRVTVAGQEVTFEVKEKNGKKIKTSAGCIL